MISAIQEYFFAHFLIPVWGQIVTIKSSWDEFALETALFNSNNLFRAKTYFKVVSSTSPKGPICFAWHNQSDCMKILEPPWSVFDIEPYDRKTLDIAPKCGIIQQTQFLGENIPRNNTYTWISMLSEMGSSGFERLVYWFSKSVDQASVCFLHRDYTFLYSWVSSIISCNRLVRSVL